MIVTEDDLEAPGSKGLCHTSSFEEPSGAIDVVYIVANLDVIARVVPTEAVIPARTEAFSFSITSIASSVTLFMAGMACAFNPP
jgi:hypothetical protein